MVDSRCLFPDVSPVLKFTDDGKPPKTGSLSGSIHSGVSQGRGPQGNGREGRPTPGHDRETFHRVDSFSSGFLRVPHGRGGVPVWRRN